MNVEARPLPLLFLAISRLISSAIICGGGGGGGGGFGLSPPPNSFFIPPIVLLLTKNSFVVFFVSFLIYWPEAVALTASASFMFRYSLSIPVADTSFSTFNNLLFYLFFVFMWHLFSQI
jgi:hypothetical protein